MREAQTRLYLSQRSVGKPVSEPQVDTLQGELDVRKRNLVKEMKKGSPTPELLTRYWQAVYDADGKKAEFSVVVPPCDWSEKQLETLTAQGGRLVFVPDELTMPDGLGILQRMYPELGNFTMRDGMLITQERSGGGWIGVESDIDAPLRNSSDDAAREIYGFLGLQGQRLSTYIIASLDSWRLTGDLFDYRTESRLIDSRCGEKYAYASFPDNDRNFLRINLAMPGDSYPYVGTRSEESRPE
jgi:hypothetical protein